MNRLQARTIVLLTAATAVVLSGCGGKENNAAEPKERTPSPVTLRLASKGAAPILDAEFQQVVGERLKAKYPHITLEYLPETTGTKLDELIASGNAPDLIVTNTGALAEYRDMELLFDMEPLFKSRNLNLSRFEANYITDVRNASVKNELYGLPINVSYHAMYYNKDIFDQAGAPYPTDGMYWDDVLNLAKKVTRNVGGVQYHGLDPGYTIIWMSQPLSIGAIDANDQVTINNDKWKRVFELAKAIYTIPGNELIAESPKNQFMKSKTLGMLLDLNILTQLVEAEKDGLHWDVAQYPSYPEKPKTYGNASVSTVIVSKTTKHQEDAVSVIEAMTSDEVQMELSKRGRLSPLASDTIKKALGSSSPGLKDKHLPSIFKSKPVPYPISSPNRGQGESIAINKFKEYLQGTIDVNQALSQAEEEIKKKLATIKGAK
ncbi:ABC transporter substrate-binding protein [Paenibacillus ginsengarvi]|uniref:Extracellular solute-binding protein n=1 Tax=Paenibacillus ginsengarvi TaxID=400777 RepID=A0A3B0BCJ0_9BACL|nr:extracellular solute-binding protein [Paenibacillus ginsengarvi]RKN70088.1 extracellular solute-binding protein [Paenibacillus ginsengarvi]